MTQVDAKLVEVIAPNFKRRLSGVTSTIVRLVPLQAQQITIATAGSGLPAELPHLSVIQLLTMSRYGPHGARVWHARRNVEMLGGLLLKVLLRKNLKLLFTSASQRKHTGYTKWLISKMDQVIATSAKGAKYLEVPAQVVHHGINTRDFTPTADKPALRRKLGLPEEAILVGCYGRIRAQKGTDVFVDAMLEILKNHPKAVGVVMGRATEKHVDFARDLRARVAAAGMQDRLLFPPEVPVWEVAQWYQALDLYVAPQRWEGFGLTPLEAMSCGVPVVATRVGAFEELIAPDITGKLIDPGEVSQMIEAIDAVLTPEGRLSAWSVASRQRVEEQFAIEREAETLIAIYRALLNN
ncbi:glycosyltransferase family 4 protein [Tritonibacter mobilis]|uniref:glycosyltransferase family 4 protein n=1 Tax=Tritonibacter mobilis TaxID=379347 RepID=UPI001C08CEBF|nr:glycosyltransferase family 4 protein [Tritonibacter mobilis]MBU3035915.1 glycosyltransferase family 4 protein [Tritonibacter mobilis]WHQ81492.1 glycosyltransferase family 4 protein [Tritonibacter mobilis]